MLEWEVVLRDKLRGHRMRAEADNATTKMPVMLRSGGSLHEINASK